MNKTELPPLTPRQEGALAEHIGELMKTGETWSRLGLAEMFDDRVRESENDEPELAADFRAIAAKLRSL